MSNKASKTATRKTTRKSNLSAKQIHKIYSAAASKAWVTIYQNKLKAAKSPAQKKQFAARLRELRAA